VFIIIRFKTKALGEKLRFFDLKKFRKKKFSGQISEFHIYSECTQRDELNDTNIIKIGDRHAKLNFEKLGLVRPFGTASTASTAIGRTKKVSFFSEMRNFFGVFSVIVCKCSRPLLNIEVFIQLLIGDAEITFLA
jgi:hypothetical protein